MILSSAARNSPQPQQASSRVRVSIWPSVNLPGEIANTSTTRKNRWVFIQTYVYSDLGPVEGDSEAGQLDFGG